jgi:hypothetical protein
MVLIRTDERLRQGVLEGLPPDARQPEELAIADGLVAVADPVARCVFVRAKDGTWSRRDSIGGLELMRPSGVAFRAGAAGVMVVSDAARDACIVEARDGTAVLVGERGVLDEQFWDPQGIVRSDLGLIVIDRGNHRYERFTDGKDGDSSFAWNLTGTLGRYYDRKRRGSPGAPPLDAPSSTPRSNPLAPGGES